MCFRYLGMDTAADGKPCGAELSRMQIGAKDLGAMRSGVNYLEGQIWPSESQRKQED